VKSKQSKNKINMEKKQTAVEWFQEQIIKIVNGTCELSEAQIFLKAKQMEREQIVNAFSEGTRMVDINDELSARFNACVYYADTFNDE
jgi:hypothetical protein